MNETAMLDLQEAAVAPPSTKGAGAISLYDAFDDLQALIDTEEGGIPDEVRAEFEAALAATREVATAKVDRCLRFHAVLKKEIAFHVEEKNRIAASQQRVENMLERFRCYLLHVVNQFGERKPKKKGSEELGPATLKGNFGSIAARAGGSEVDVEDMTLVPARYLKTSVALSAEQWSELIEAYADKYGDDARSAMLKAIKIENTVDKKAIEAAIVAGAKVPGADIRFDKEDVLTVR